MFTVTLLYFYMIFYNLTLLGFFWITNSSIILNVKTLYSLNTFSFNSFYLFFITVFLFSLAGVPPFTGFFNKLFIFNLIFQNGFFLLYTLLIIILLVGLYFYMQNLRFLHSTNYNYSYKPFLGVERHSLSLHYYLVIKLLLLANGVFLLDDFLLTTNWLLC
jgi:NADH-quinone oxidoreductase subunit N